MAGSDKTPYFLCAMLLAASLSACGSAEEQPAEPAPVDASQTGDGVTEEGQTQDIPSSQSALNVDLTDTPTEAAVLSGDLVRPANFYALEWDDTAALCRIALDELNMPFSMSPDLKTTSDGAALDYASEQASRFLGINDSVAWSWVEDQSAGTGYSEKATIDFFNDDIERTVVRMRGQLGGNRIIGLGIEENGNITHLSFGYAGAVVKDLPDQEDLNTKLTYSVADVLRLGGNHYTLLMPLKDFDKSERVYLVTWHPKDNTNSPRIPSDYFSKIACVFRSVNAHSNDRIQD